jgi:hypothetical protein
MSVKAYSFNSFEEEVLHLIQILSHLLLSGESVAIISRKHHLLMSLAKTFSDNNIPVAYEKKDNVLNQKHIKWIINLLSFISSLNQESFLSEESLLPEILAYPFWEIEPIVLYDISITAYKNKSTWIQTMLNYDCKLSNNPDINKFNSSKIRNIAEFLLSASRNSKYLSLAEMLDWVLGVNQDQDYQIQFNAVEENLNDNTNLELV